ncbi:MAG TPA: hypothetical protein VKB86_20760 [Pyrinomonadaceae bacterium]|nr:hypothetical protein [Pyrinomonadaceae bacterium]
MSNVSNINGVRKSALDRIERSERHSKIAFFGAGLVEVAFLAGFFLLADLRNRTHVLLLLATVAVYTILALGLVVLGSYMNRNTLRILNAIELLDRDDASRKVS